MKTVLTSFVINNASQNNAAREKEGAWITRLRGIIRGVYVCMVAERGIAGMRSDGRATSLRHRYIIIIIIITIYTHQ